MPKGIPNDKGDKNHLVDDILKTAQQSKDTVEVKKDTLAILTARLDKLEAENKKLTEISDKGRLAHWESTHKGAVPRQYQLSVFKDNIITSWDMKQNRVWKDEKGNWQENQQIELTFDNGEIAVVPYIEFVTNTQKIDASLVSSEQKGGMIYLTVETKEGKKLIINSLFIN